MLFVNLVGKGKLKQVAMCLRNFSGEVGGIWVVREFVEEWGLDFEKGNSDLWPRDLKDLLEAQRQGVGIKGYIRRWKREFMLIRTLSFIPKLLSVPSSC